MPGSDERHFVLMLLLGQGVCSFFFLMHLRKAALLMAGLSILPSLVLYASDGTMVGWSPPSTSRSLALAMMIVMLSYARDYASLAKSHLAVEALGEENARLAAVDMVTNLPNRREFFRELGVEVDRFGAEHDGFSIGIRSGWLQARQRHTWPQIRRPRTGAGWANRLKECVGPEATFYRLGGDEFVFIHRAQVRRKRAAGNDQDDIESVLMPLDVGSITRRRSAARSAWLGSRNRHPMQNCSTSTATKRFTTPSAEAGNGRSSLSDEHRRIMLDQGATEQALRAADLEQELYPVFQPITEFCARAARVAYECLAALEQSGAGAGFAG